MNTDNNLENNMGSESLGVAQTPVSNEPINNGGGEGFVPFQDLNNAPLNVPAESTDVQPTPIVQTESLNVQPTLYQPEPVQSPVEQPVDTFVQSPVQEPVAEQAPALDAVQAAPTIENIEQTPSIETPTYAEQAPTVEPVVDNTINQDVYTAQAEQPMVNENENQGPTLPIPDQMPGADYQAGVSTPVDYATPMSDFDQIGTTPELDPKAKGKRSNKGLLAVLLILLIAALGAGSYYAINVLGIFNKDSVTVKEVTVEKGEQPSTIIDDYATFSNTSASNCSLDTSNVNTSTVGTYDFTVTCGDKKYTGKVTVKDTKGPQIEAKTNVVIAGTVLLPEMLVSTADEDATYTFDSDQEKDKFMTAGLKKIKLTATDASSNASSYSLPN